jgi:hypothetical protein
MTASAVGRRCLSGSVEHRFPRPRGFLPSNEAQRESAIEVFLGLVILVVLVVAAAYFLEIGGECVRNNVAATNSNDINEYLAHRAFGYRITVSVIAGVILWGGLRLFSRFFHKLQISCLEPVAVIVEIVIAGLIPMPYFLARVCLASAAL